MIMIGSIQPNKVYIVDLYFPLHKSENYNVVKTIHFRDSWYCIREVTLEWGQPILSRTIIDEEEFKHYRIYSTIEEAEAYIHQLKEGEGIYK